MFQMTKEEATKELAKVAVSFKMLQSGVIGGMSDSDFEEFMEWLN